MPLIAVVSDTHVPTRAPEVPAALLDALEGRGPDAILHAGDVVVEGALEPFEAIAETHAVRGNMERFDLPETYTDRFGDIGVAMRHKPRNDTSLRTFGEANDADIVIHGHTHVARDEDLGGVRVLNPGSPTQPRRGEPSYAMIDVEGGTASVEHHGF